MAVAVLRCPPLRAHAPAEPRPFHLHLAALFNARGCARTAAEVAAAAWVEACRQTTTAAVLAATADAYARFLTLRCRATAVGGAWRAIVDL
eukprot:4804059-Prymnesium_polylepis.1